VLLLFALVMFAACGSGYYRAGFDSYGYDDYYVRNGDRRGDYIYYYGDWYYRGYGTPYRWYYDPWIY